MNVGLSCIPFLSLISYGALFSAFVIMMIKYHGIEDERKVWIGSKILTIKKLLDKNNNYTYPILSIGREGNIISYNKNYESLLKDSNKDCEKNKYKKCGILDTLGNIMCIPKEDICPINSLIVDLQSKEDEYINKGYQVAFISNISNDSYIYYTNNETDNNIVVKINITETIPKYISKDNLIFDNDTFHDYFSPPSSYDYDDDDDDYDYDYDYDYHSFKVKNRTKRKKILQEQSSENKTYDYGNYDIDPYIKERFNDEINVDKTYKNVSNNLYIGNYLGFKDYNNMKNFSTFDLYDTYFTVFPNKTANVFCYICSILIGVGIIIYLILTLCIFFIQEQNCLSDLAGIVGGVSGAGFYVYLPSFIGYFSYTLYELSNIYEKNRPYELSNIKADPFIEDLLKEIQGRHCEEIYIIIVIILLASSFGALIIKYIHSIFYYIREKRMSSSNIEQKSQKTELLTNEN